ncbi:acyl-CoA:lysophosphatidylglycerol acyltransferase 1-like [Brevipalpus obovatus]|uniref:acyl-CoA:lysophosphatidylglycerol acyltransferase 1-like n=1 Tax=Brevipalpus obovatus TaxID=246614 RepID=UPI003D9E8266
MKLFTCLYGYIRFLIVIIQNIYVIPCYLVINWVFLLPLRLIKPSLFYKIENNLYSWTLYVVSSWSWLAGIQVFELGVNLSEIAPNNKRKPKFLVVSNHQSTADVPLVMYNMTSHPELIKMWVISAEFKYTNFGPVSLTHEDYFLSQKRYVKGDLVKHCLGLGDQRKNCYVLFPEGGFRYKRIQTSDSFAAKNGLPSLKRVVWPRYGAFEELADVRLGVTHIVDLTILYADQDKTLSIIDIAKGIRREPVYFVYRVFELDCDDDDDDDVSPITDGSPQNELRHTARNRLNLEWLQNLWKEKEQLIEDFYSDQENFFQTYGNGRPIDLSYSKLFFIHIFFISIMTAIILSLYTLYILIAHVLFS